MPTEIDAAALRRWPLPTDVHNKHDRGTVLVVGGSSATAGAAILAGLAALRMGAGRLQLAVGAPVARQVAVAVPEAMVIGLPERPDGALRPRRAVEQLGELLATADAVLVGPGLVGGDRMQRLLELVIGRVGHGTRVVVDAAAVIALASGGATRVAPLAGRLAMTPNGDELAALLDGGGGAAAEPAGTEVAAAAAWYGATVSCYSEIAAPDGRRWHCAPGGPSLGTSGSGDVLAGLVAGALARTDDVARAVCWATYAHNRSAAHARTSLGTFGVLARDLLDAVPCVLRELDPPADSPG